MHRLMTIFCNVYLLFYSLLDAMTNLASLRISTAACVSWHAFFIHSLPRLSLQSIQSYTQFTCTGAQHLASGYMCMHSFTAVHMPAFLYVSSSI